MRFKKYYLFAFIGIAFVQSGNASENELFPLGPFCFTSVSAMSYGMGDVNLFSEGSVSAFYNPANIGNNASLSLGAGYELRDSFPQSFIIEHNVSYIPQSLGITLPPRKIGRFNVLFVRLYKSERKLMGTISYYDTSCISGFLIGYRKDISQKLVFGISGSYLWGKYASKGHLPLYLANEENCNIKGTGIILNLVYKPFEKSTYAFRIGYPGIIWGEEKGVSHIGAGDSWVDTVRDHIPWDIEMGVKRRISINMKVLGQLTYRNWDRYNGRDFFWGIHEWDFNAGMELKLGRFFVLRTGSYLNLFYYGSRIPFFVGQKGKTDLRAIIISPTIGVGIRHSHIKIDIGVGKSFIQPEDALAWMPSKSPILINVSYVF